MKNRSVIAGVLAVAGLVACVNGQETVDAKRVNAQPEVKAPAQEVKPLAIGDKAPKLEIEKWIKGTEVKGFETGKVYVVEFWATWCPPCRDSIPHLTEMQKKHKDKLVIVGVAGSEQNGLTDLEPFVTGLGDKMDYTVAFDGARKTSKSYMEASGQRGIPTAFIVDQKGTLAWIGHPMDGMDKVVEEVLAGKFDVMAAANKQKRMAELEKQMMPLMQEAGFAYQSGDHATVLKKMDEILALDSEMLAEWSLYKFQFMIAEMKDVDGAYAAINTAIGTNLKDNDGLLMAVAMAVLEEPSIPDADRRFETAVVAASRANQLTGGKEVEVLAVLADAHFKSGDTNKAITTLTEAIKLGDADAKAALGAKLDEYKKSASAG